MKEQYASIAGYKIRFLEKGKGPPLVLLHGLGGSLEWWGYNLDVLSREYRTIAFDFPGFGYSTKSGLDFSKNSASDFMVSFLEAFHIRRVSLIGNSMGGLIAFFTAMNHPERIDNLILVNSVGFGVKLSLPLRLGTIFPLGELVLSARNNLIARILLNRMFYDSQKVPSHLIPTVLEIFDMPQTGKACLRVLRSGVDLKGLKKEICRRVRDGARSLPHRTLIIWGADDKVAPLSQAYAGKNLIKNSQLHVFDKCGHLPQVEWPMEFNHLVLEFLGSG